MDNDKIWPPVESKTLYTDCQKIVAVDYIQDTTLYVKSVHREGGSRKWVKYNNFLNLHSYIYEVQKSIKKHRSCGAK